MYHPIPVYGMTVNLKTYDGGGVPAIFDAFLYRPSRGGNQLKLTIKVNIKLRQVAPRSIPLQPDADNKPFWTSPWSTTDWQQFLQAAQAQANMWNNKFWLLPPSTFSDFDVTFHGFPDVVYRPNIRCELVVDFNPAGDAHRTIDVANLNLGLLTGQAQGPGTFRSHALLYDSLDAVPWAFPYGNGAGQPTMHYVIAHEIGHAIGLGHIGTLLKTPLCDFAIASERVGIDHHPLTQGGRNSFYCYGYNQGIKVVGNIMGAGDAFTVESARPWLWAIGSMRKSTFEAAQWRAVTDDPGPGSWVKTKSPSLSPAHS